MVIHQVLLSEEYSTGKTCSAEIVRQGSLSKQEEGATDDSTDIAVELEDVRSRVHVVVETNANKQVQVADVVGARMWETEIWMYIQLMSLGCWSHMRTML